MKKKHLTMFCFMFLVLFLLFSGFSQSLSSLKTITYQGDGDTKYWAIIAGYGGNPHQIPCVNKEITKYPPLSWDLIE